MLALQYQRQNSIRKKKSQRKSSRNTYNRLTGKVLDKNSKKIEMEGNMLKARAFQKRPQNMETASEF